MRRRDLHFKYIVFLCLLLELFLSSETCAQSSESKNNSTDFLHRLIRSANTNYEIRAAEIEVDASRSDWEATRALDRPQLNLTASGGLTRIFAHGGGNYPDGSAFLELRQNLWNHSLSVQKLLRKAEGQERAANAKNLQTTILRRFAMLYIDWINACQSIVIYENQKNLLERILQASRKRYAMGDDAKLNVHLAEMRLITSQGQIRQAQARAQALSKRLAIEAHDQSPSTASSEQFEYVFTQLLKHLENENFQGSELRTARLNLADANVEASRNLFGPRLDFVARYGATNFATNTTYTYSGKTLVPEMDLFLELTWPLFDSFSHNANERATLLRRNSVEERNKAEVDITREQIYDWKSNQSISQESKATYERVIKIAQARTKGLETQFRAGMNTLFDLLNAAEEMLAIERQKVIDFQLKLQADLELATSSNVLKLENLKKLAEKTERSHEQHR